MTGRENELKFLNQYYGKSGLKTMVVYGQKGIGKGTILSEFCKGKQFFRYACVDAEDREQRYQLSLRCHAAEEFASWDDLLELMVLDEDVVNKSIPLILCKEEDVEGEHGATIGDLSDEVLLYFRSRGIDDETAYQLMAKGRLIGCVRQIPDEKLRAQLMAELGEEPEEETKG